MIRLKMPNGRYFNAGGFIEPSLKDIYQKKLMDHYSKNAGIQPIEEYRKDIRAIKEEYSLLMSQENSVQ